MTRSRSLAALAFVIIVVAACGGTAYGSPAAPSADPTKDKLAQVLARGTLALSTHDAGGITAKDFELARLVDAAG